MTRAVNTYDICTDELLHNQLGLFHESDVNLHESYFTQQTVIHV